ncbi:S9 family peptidase [Rubripirellula reticaptiva]|uniref:Prolyl tripeptidyl peptidase n=1 Tax=Rubripirellula reticaptiva TaxID=2528013 RepID=A0A5C6EGX9_9BACT|nr:DPP IV N-terminal domain-containing protein [Rubripirellula reticaptiva]TWU49083.1 Prolyl tripeptidyl peptidase precursor [Rubripirellula reticaptiva]
MKPILKHVIFFAAFALNCAWFTEVRGQDLNWQDESAERLRAIYDRNEFRVPNVEPEWLPDSSGYKLRETDSKTHKPVVALYDANSGTRSVVEDTDTTSLLSPDGKHVVKIRNRKVFVHDVDGDKKVQLTEDVGDRDISYRDLRWSPSGNYVSFVEVDNTDVKQRSVLVPGDPSYPGVAQHRFARVGGTLASLRVGVTAAGGGIVRWLPIDVPDEGFYLGQVDWISDSDELLVETMSRFRDKREFWIASVNGTLNRIYSEVNDAWAVGSHGINSGAEWIRDGEAFVFISEKDGWRHAWLLSRDGKTETKLTPGEFDLIDRAQIDEAGGWYYFYASPDNATQKYLYRVPLDGSGTLQRITPADQPGTHEYTISPDAKWATHTYSTLNDPPVVDLVELPDHKVVRVLDDHSELREKYQQMVTHPTEFVQIDIGDGVMMDASLTKPRDFDESKKYPVFVYVYGEPYLQTVLDKWGAAQIDFLRVVADNGYITVSIDNRGTAAPKGAAWRRSIFGSLGPLSTEEQAAGIQKLAEMKPYVDLDRVGIWGWSGGGSNTLNAMFRKPEVYHVGIAVVPKPQPWLYNAWFQEIYMRTREVNADGYERSAPINFAEGLKGKLLIVTGSGETNTHIQIIEGLVDRLIELGKPFDYMVYPNRDHGLREGPGTVVHVRMLILRYLIENLPPGPR